MGNLSQLLDAVSGDPPPPVFDLNAVIARGNRQRRVRIAGTAALSTAVVIAGSTGVFALADHNAVVCGAAVCRSYADDRPRVGDRRVAAWAGNDRACAESHRPAAGCFGREPAAVRARQHFRVDADLWRQT